jgi:hypothetical protein
MSHNVLARTARSGDETVVEAITKVQSIDLVADPATTSGLYEHAQGQESRDEGRGPAKGPSDPALDARPSTLDALTLDELRSQRPDLICEIELAYDTQLEEMRTKLDEMIVQNEASRRRERIFQLLEENDLPLPSSSDAGESLLVTPQFLASLMHAGDDGILRRLIEERAELVRAAGQWKVCGRLGDRRPRSRDQLEFPFMGSARPVHNAAEFAAAVRGR